MLARCAFDASAIRVGSKNFTESFVIAEIYAQALEAAGLRVERLFNLGSTQIAMAAMERGNIDLYPEYTGTALIDVLHLAPIANPRAAYAVVSRLFEQRYGIVWLAPSPMNDSQALATTRDVAAAQATRNALRRFARGRGSAPGDDSRVSRAAGRFARACNASTADFGFARFARTTSP